MRRRAPGRSGVRGTDEEDDEGEEKGALRYVSVAGRSDKQRKKGSRENPFRTIQEALKGVKSGTTIVVLPGEYKELLRLDARSARDRITLRGEGSQRPTILAPSGGEGTAVVQVLKGRWVLDNLEIDVDHKKMVGVHFEANTGSTLSDCEVHGGRAGAGILLNGSEDVTLERNKIHDFEKRDENVLEDAHGVLVLGGSRGIRISANDISPQLGRRGAVPR